MESILMRIFLILLGFLIGVQYGRIEEDLRRTKEAAERLTEEEPA